MFNNVFRVFQLFFIYIIVSFFAGMANKSPNRSSLFNKSSSSHTANIAATASTASKPPPPIRRSSSISSQDAQELAVASRTSSFRGANEDDEATPHGSLGIVSYKISITTMFVHKDFNTKFL